MLCYSTSLHVLVYMPTLLTMIYKLSTCLDFINKASVTQLYSHLLHTLFQLKQYYFTMTLK